MSKPRTNFAALMDILGISAQEISVAIDANITLISKWRTGSRRLISGRHWVKNIVDYFIENDSSKDNNIILSILEAYYHLDNVITEHDKKILLERWLCSTVQYSEQYQKKRKEIMLDIFAKAEKSGQPDRKSSHTREILGESAIKQTILELLEQSVELTNPMEMFFVCPDGIGLLTSDDIYGKDLMKKLNILFECGFRFNVVLRTDFKISDVAAFSGPWLVAHLVGYISSYYYDDFRRIKDECMFGGIGDRFVIEVDRVDSEYRCLVSYDTENINRVTNKYLYYLERAACRFHYHFFQQPDDYLINISGLQEAPCYLFSKSPIFGTLKIEYYEPYLKKHEIEFISKQFSPFFISIDSFSSTVKVRHMFCSDVINDTLDKMRFLCQELTDMTNRRIFLHTQVLVDQLKQVKENLKKYRNYNVCFMSEDVFSNILMQIGVWGNSAAIGWITGGRSTACKDYTNSGALQGFCGMVWDKIPGVMRSRNLAIHKIDSWLKRAKKFGLDV